MATCKYSAPLRPGRISTSLLPNGLLLMDIESLRFQISCLRGLKAGLVFFLVPGPTQISWSLLCILGDWFGFSLGFASCFSWESSYNPVSFPICPTDFRWGAPWLLDTLVPSCPSALWCSCYFGVYFTAIKWTLTFLGSGKCNILSETNKFQGELLCEFVKISMFCRTYDFTH